MAQIRLRLMTWQLRCQEISFRKADVARDKLRDADMPRDKLGEVDVAIAQSKISTNVTDDAT